MGATALLAQVVLTRELLSLFLGNELSIAFVLAVWLVAVAAGSAIGVRVASRLPRPEPVFGWTQLALAVILPAALLVGRSLHPVGLTAGEVLGPGAMLLTSLETLAPVCLLLGLQFVLAASSAARRMAGIAPVARIYALEAAGAALGGLAFHLYLSQHVLAFSALAFAGLLNFVSALSLLRPRGLAQLLAAQLLAAVLVAALALAPTLEILSVQSSPRWSGYTVLDHAPSRYGDLTLVTREAQLSVFQSGVLLFTTEDDYANEILAHPPLLEHPNPRRVLLIGSALGGLPGEILKHGIERLDCVELDPKLAAWVSRVAELRSQAVNDPRVRLAFGDARLFVRRAPPASYDVIILAIPDPTTAAINRFYTREFLQEAKRALAPGGILSLHLTGSAHHLSGAVLLSAATLDRTLRLVFPEQLLVPGDTMLFLAANRPGALTPEWTVLSERLRARHVTTQFVNDAWLEDALLPFRSQLVGEQLAQVVDAPVNTDLNPISYYYQSRLWLDQLSSRLSRPLKALAAVRVWWGLLLIALAAVLAAAAGPRLRVASILIASAAIGAFGLVVEVLGLLVFQAALGYLYHALGALFAAFMAGLAAGSSAVSGRRFDESAAARLLLVGLLTSALICALLPGFLQALLPAPALAGIAVGLLLLLVGSVVGAMFPVASHLYKSQQPVAAAAGALYAADLVGSAGAAVFAGAIAVPMLGVAGAAQLTALVAASALVLCLPLLRGERGS